MAKTASDLTAEKVYKLVRRLNEKERGSLVDKLITDAFDKTVKNFRENIKKQKLTAKQINKIVEEARREYYEKSGR